MMVQQGLLAAESAQKKDVMTHEAGGETAPVKINYLVSDSSENAQIDRAFAQDDRSCSSRQSC